MKAILRKDKCLAAIGERPDEVTDDIIWDEMDGNAIAILHLALADGVFLRYVAAAILEKENRRNNREDMQTSSRQVEALVVTKGRKDCWGLNTSYPQRNVASILEDGNALCCEAAVANKSRKRFADVWLFNTGATFHMTTRREWFHQYKPISGCGSMYSCNDHELKIIGIGSITVKMHDGTVRTIRDVRHVEGLKKNLLSLGQLDDLGYKMEIHNKIMKIIKGALVLMRGEKVAANLYQLKGEIIEEAEALVASNSLSHRYFISFIDDYSRRCWVYPIKKKSDVFEVFKVYKARVELDSGKKIKCLRTDNGGEYTGDEFDTFYKQEGIKRQFTTAYTPQQNKVAERMNRTLLEEQEKFELKTPMEMWTGKPNNYSDLHIFHDVQYPRNYNGGSKIQKMLVLREAMQEEIKALHKNKTWELVPLPGEGRNRLQRNFFPCGSNDNNSSGSGKCATYDLHLEQLDVKTAFLHGNLEEEIYMLRSEGFKQKRKENLVCRLNKSLYGLKQARRCWYKRFDSFIRSLGYNRLHADPCAYFKRFGNNDFIILLLYVDYMLVTGPNKYRINNLKAQLVREFKMKDLGPANKILGMQIYRDRVSRKIWLSQKSYVKKILQRFNMQDCKPISTPFPTNVKLSFKMSPSSEKERMEMSRVPYASTMGSLMFAMICTRPDIAHAVGVVSRYMAKPGREHWEAVKRIFRYIKGTSDVALCFGDTDLIVTRYVNYDYAGDLDGSKSTTGYVFTLSGGTVSWVSKLQSVVTMSTTEAEYVTTAQANKEAVWLKMLLEELEYKQEKITLFCDNQSALYLARNPTFHKKTKHIRVQYHFVREKLEEGIMDMQKIHTYYNVADYLTKAINCDKFIWCRSSCGLAETCLETIPKLWMNVFQAMSNTYWNNLYEKLQKKGSGVYTMYTRCSKLPVSETRSNSCDTHWKSNVDRERRVTVGMEQAVYVIKRLCKKPPIFSSPGAVSLDTVITDPKKNAAEAKSRGNAAFNQKKYIVIASLNLPLRSFLIMEVMFRSKTRFMRKNNNEFEIYSF
uniref:Retrovirus-related Pol polyprotein from transposon TNT 1-94 n=1 Tax=Tanacetum cinerariifolium TaxID=118510 RepID=A0A6L2JRI2_TANCI|nr:retrovirus-related Pol polyprotein from transposon TNT 1-94 [Tanacetum cinerariifolium]